MERDHVDAKLDRCLDIPNLDLEAEGIVERIQGLERRLRLTMEETLEEHGLSYGEWRLLGALRRADGRQSTPGALSTQLELSSGAMTNRLDRLEHAGLIRRLPDPHDRRGVRVELTEAGDGAWLESTSTQAVKEALVAGALSRREQQQLNGLLRKLMLEFERLEREPALGRAKDTAAAGGS
jgi:DNA-binding MarR family transcriptional regulator